MPQKNGKAKQQDKPPIEKQAQQYIFIERRKKQGDCSVIQIS
jgi:hypothetical protein